MLVDIGKINCNQIGNLKQGNSFTRSEKLTQNSEVFIVCDSGCIKHPESVLCLRIADGILHHFDKNTHVYHINEWKTVRIAQAQISF